MAHSENGQFFHCDEPFDAVMNEALGLYVYALYDPETNLPFYVGKGGGDPSLGNRRVLEHLTEAKNKLGHAEAVSKKIATIHRIWAKGKEVDWKILRRKLRDTIEAHTIEASIIDAFKSAGIELTNEQAGYESFKHGLTERADAYALAALPFDEKEIPVSLIGRSIFMFSVEGGYRIYKDYAAATKGDWAMGKEYQKMAGGVILGVVDQVCRYAAGFSDWVPAPASPNRWVALEVALADEERSSFVNKSMNRVISQSKGFWLRGGFLVFQVTQKREIMLLRGKSRVET